MAHLFKTITVALGIITAIFGGYYLFISGAASTTDAEGEMALQEMLKNTSVFISHSQELDKISLDLSLFEDQRFRSLRLYTAPIEEQPTGRTNPFGAPN
jgi:hypothetical protein